MSAPELSGAVREQNPRNAYRLNGQPLKPVHDWVKQYEQTWNQRFEALDEVLEELRESEEADGGKGE